MSRVLAQSSRGLAGRMELRRWRRWLLAGTLLAACAGQDLAAALYTNESDFVTAIGTSASYLNDFNNLTVSMPFAHPLEYAANGLACRITSQPFFEIFSLPGAVSTMYTDSVMVVTLTSSNVHAVGGWFYLTDASGALADGWLSVVLSDGTTQSVSSVSGPAPLFTGFTSGATLLDSVLVRSDTPGAYPTLDHFHIAEGVPAFSVATAGSGHLVIAWPAPATGYTLQTSPEFPGTNWTLVTEKPQRVGDQMQVVIPAQGQTAFFRLRRF